MKHSVDISLGYAPELYQLFSYSNPVVPLTDVVSHMFNQTLERDMFWGSWADAYVKEGGEYRIKLTSPNHDLSAYTTVVPAYLAAGRLALKAFNARVTNANGLQFQLPFGLAMANVRSVQLFHFPPSETSSYSDYLYSPTNRRWEALLVENGFDGRERTLLERIIDLVPIAAAGGAGQEIDKFNTDFTDYVRAQLVAFLGGHHTHTPPVVAMGAPAREWLEDTFKLKRKLAVLSLTELEIIPGQKTPVLCANHPSQFLYYTSAPPTKAAPTLNHDVRQVEGAKSGPTEESPFEIMRQDLVAAGWQAAMAKDWGADPEATLHAAKERWTNEADVKRVVASEDQEFGYAR